MVNDEFEVKDTDKDRRGIADDVEEVEGSCGIGLYG